jgi:hypothetical protein
VAKRKSDQTVPEKKPGPRRGSSQLAKRADLVLSDVMADGPPDGLMSEREVAAWFRCSTQNLAKLRKNGRGPLFQAHGPRMIRYRRGDCLKYLEKISYQSTADYERKTKTGARSAL